MNPANRSHSSTRTSEKIENLLFVTFCGELLFFGANKNSHSHGRFSSAFSHSVTSPWPMKSHPSKRQDKLKRRENATQNRTCEWDFIAGTKV